MGAHEEPKTSTSEATIAPSQKPSPVLSLGTAVLTASQDLAGGGLVVKSDSSRAFRRSNLDEELNNDKTVVSETTICVPNNGEKDSAGVAQERITLEGAKDEVGHKVENLCDNYAAENDEDEDENENENEDEDEDIESEAKDAPLSPVASILTTPDNDVVPAKNTTTISGTPAPSIAKVATSVSVPIVVDSEISVSSDLDKAAPSKSLPSQRPSTRDSEDDSEEDTSVMAGILQGHLDRYGFATMDPNRPNGTSAISMARTRQTYVSKVETSRQRRQRVRLENLRARKWLRMLDKWKEQLTKKRARLDRRVRKGVPDCFRDKAWPLLVEEALKKKGVAPPGSARPSVLRLETTPTFEELLALTNRSSDAEMEKIRECIYRDVGRTFPRHVIFLRRGGVGQSALTNVLRAYASLDKEVGYCQGMGFLVGFLLGYLPERKAFEVLRALMLSSPWSMCELYKPGMPGSQLILAQFEELLKRYVPDVAKHLDKELIVPSMYATQWFITVFTYNFPFDVVVRVWDIFLFDGWCIVHQVALAILKVNRKALLSRKFEQILEYFRDIPPTLDPQEVLSVALTIPVTEKEISSITKTMPR